ncbi:rhomboid protease [Malassezia sp. CBS 17886]|nr:rhomboid protease [Malassezia sp. CBS 17886]
MDMPSPTRAAARTLHVSVPACRAVRAKPFSPFRALRPGYLLRRVEAHVKRDWGGEPVVRPPITKAVAFFAALSAGTFLACAVWASATEERLTRDRGARVLGVFPQRRQSLQAEALEESAASFGAGLQTLRRVFRAVGAPESVQEPVLRAYLSSAEWYLELPSSQRAAVPIIGVNALVFLAWQLAPRFSFVPFMRRVMTHRPASGRVATMTTSVFSHRAPMHFLFNNVALWSVGGSGLAVVAAHAAGATRGGDPTPLPHFVAFFVTAGTFAALVSHLRVAVRWRLLERRVQALYPVRNARGVLERAVFRLVHLARCGTLGSSGAIYASFVLCACAFPSAKLSFFFLPFTAMPIQWGVLGLVGMDLVGLMRGWQIFDHAAHLGGAAFGLLYFYGGGAVWNHAKALVRSEGKPA